jgi:hypothetical protein
MATPFFFDGEEYALVRLPIAEPPGAEYLPLADLETAQIVGRVGRVDPGLLVRLCEAAGIPGSIDGWATGDRLTSALETALGRAPTAQLFRRARPASSGRGEIKDVDLADLLPPQSETEPTEWIEIQFVDEADAPVSGVVCEIELPDGGKRLGRTNALGILRVEGIAKPGTCKVRFPQLHKDAFEAA